MAERGRNARNPLEVPWRGWLDVVLRVQRRIQDENIPLLAAGLALYALLAVFPGLAAAVALYGLFASAENVSEQVAGLGPTLPEPALEIIAAQLRSQVERQDSVLGAGALAGLAIALWSARRGVGALMSALNITYTEREKRGFLKQLLLSLLYTVVALLGYVCSLALTVAVPLVIEMLGVGGLAGTVTLLARWLLLWLLVVVALSALYRHVPDRRSPQWRWTALGAVIGASLWVLGSMLFDFYVQNFGSYGETYGALGGVVVLLLWFFLSAFTVLLGSLMNAELEHQTEQDSTVGAPRPMGERGAFVADTVRSAGRGHRDPED